MRFDEDTHAFTVWNFGDAEEQSAAMCSGDKGKLAKATKKIDKLILSRCDDLRNDPQKMKTIVYPYIGTVSTFKSRDGYEIVTLFGLKFYINPPPSVSPSSSIIIPAWLVTTCAKSANSTVMEAPLKIPLVSGLARQLWIWVGHPSVGVLFLF